MTPRPHDKARRGRWTLLGLALLFLGPLAFAWLAYFGAPSLRPSDSVAHGALIDPPQHLEPLWAARVGDRSDIEVFRGRWTLVLFSDDGCEESCVDTLIKMRQVHVALGKNMDRVDRLLILKGQPFGADGALADLPALATTTATDGLYAALVRAAGDEGAAPTAWIYLVDPLGNLMLRMDRDASPRDLHTDLKRLLRLSRIG